MARYVPSAARAARAWPAAWARARSAWARATSAWSGSSAPVAPSSNRRFEAYAKPLATATDESASASRASAATAST